MEETAINKIKNSPVLKISRIETKLCFVCWKPNCVALTHLKEYKTGACRVGNFLKKLAALKSTVGASTEICEIARIKIIEKVKKQADEKA